MIPRTFLMSACLTALLLAGSGRCVTGEPARSPQIEQRVKAFNHLYVVMRVKYSSTRDVIRMFDSAYQSLFSPLQHRATIATLKSSDVVDLFNMAFSTQYMTNEPRYIADMELDLRELERTGHAAQLQYDNLYEAFVGSRMFVEARKLRESHASAAMAPVPEFDDVSSQGRAGPTEIVVSADARRLTRRDVNLDSSAEVLVVVSPLCHFAQYSLGDIASDSKIGTAFSQHATWLVPPDDGSTPVAEVARWNREHPHEPMVLAYDYHEWPMIDRWYTPVFYFLRNGRLVSEVIGWPRAGRKPEIVAALQNVGLMPVIKR
jgi:hypothetical protein